MKNNKILSGLTSIKDQIIILIFIYHVVIPEGLYKSPREDIFSYIQNKYPSSVLSGETSQHLEEIMVDLFYNEFLVDDQNLRMDL